MSADEFVELTRQMAELREKVDALSAEREERLRALALEYEQKAQPLLEQVAELQKRVDHQTRQIKEEALLTSPHRVPR